jgi:hypothetical protein
MIEKYVSYSHGITLPNHNLPAILDIQAFRGLGVQVEALDVGDRVQHHF